MSNIKKKRLSSLLRRRDSRKQRSARRRRLFETLESRNLLAAVTLNDGNLQITDTNLLANNDVLTVSSDGTTITIKDPSNAIEGGAGTTKVDDNTVTVPVSSLTGSLNVNLGGGTDSLTFSGQITANGGITADAETIVVNPNATLRTAGNISLSAKADDLGSPTLVAKIGTTEVKFPISLDGFYFAKPEAFIDLTGATLHGAAISLTAEASAPLEPTAAQFDAFQGTGVYANSTADIKIENATITADSLTATATSSVTSDLQDKVSPGGNANTDAGLSVVIVDGNARAYISGTSTLNVSGDVTIEAMNTIDIKSSVDGSTENAVGATAAVAVAVADTKAYIGDSASISPGVDSVTVKATTNSSAASSATSTAGGAQENSTEDTKSQQLLANPDGDVATEDGAATSDGEVKFAGAVAVTVVNNDTKAYIHTSGTIASEGNINVISEATDNASATANGSNTGDSATGVGVGVAINVGNVDSIAYLDGSGSLTAGNTIDVSATLQRGDGDGFTASATSGAGASDGVGVAGSLAINVVNTNVDAVVKNSAALSLNNSDLKLTATSATHSETTADAKLEAAGTTGIGASVALFVGNNDSRAQIENGSNLTAAKGVMIEANGAHISTTTATGGAAGGTAVTPVAALAVTMNDTLAKIGTGGLLTTAGDVTIQADQANDATVSAEGAAEGDTAVGAALGLTVAKDTVNATLLRDLTSTGGRINDSGRRGCCHQELSQGWCEGCRRR